MFRYLIVVAIACSALLHSTAAGADEIEPYTAYVATRLADIHSGPQNNAYVTDRLGRGAEVEVYRRRDQGWLGIRPPADQYSLVRARDLELTEDDSIAEIVTDDAKSWVGTAFAATQRFDSHVVLQRGEFVEILGTRRASLTPGGATETLYEIAPPAGEFRWIRIGDVRRRQPRAEVAGLEFSDLQSTSGQATSPSVTPAAPAEPTALPTESERPQPSIWRSRTSVRSRELAARSANVRPGSLSKIHAEIAAAVVGDPQDWQLAPLRRRCETLLKSSPSMVERGQARIALERIEEFESLRRRKLALRNLDDKVSVASGTTPVVGNLNLPVAASTTAANQEGVLAEYDGYGILKPVHSTKRPAPPFALVNAEGKILKFVTPVPGMNLRRYVNTKIGIIGQRGVVADLDMDHVTAERVVELKRHLR